MDNEQKTKLIGEAEAKLTQRRIAKREAWVMEKLRDMDMLRQRLLDTEAEIRAVLDKPLMLFDGAL